MLGATRVQMVSTRMRQTRKCPKCDSRKFYTSRPARMSDGQSANGTTDLSLAAEWLPVGEGGFLGPKRARVEAKLEAWICAACGFSELYVDDLNTLAYLHENGAEGVAFIDATPDKEGAFR